MPANAIGMVLDQSEAAALLAGLCMLRTPSCWHGSYAEKFWGVYTRGETMPGLSEEELDDLFLRLGFDEDNFSERSWAEKLNKKILELTG